MANTEYFDACEKARVALADYCRCAVRKGLCDDGDCEFCSVNTVYDLLSDEADNASNIDKEYDDEVAKIYDALWRKADE